MLSLRCTLLRCNDRCDNCGERLTLNLNEDAQVWECDACGVELRGGKRRRLTQEDSATLNVVASGCGLGRFGYVSDVGRDDGLERRAHVPKTLVKWPGARLKHARCWLASNPGDVGADQQTDRAGRWLHGYLVAMIKSYLTNPDIAVLQMTKRTSRLIDKLIACPLSNTKVDTTSIRTWSDPMIFLSTCTFLELEDVLKFQMTAGSIDKMRKRIGLSSGTCPCRECWTEWDLPGDFRSTHFAVHPFDVKRLIMDYLQCSFFGLKYDSQVLCDNRWWRIAMARYVFHSWSLGFLPVGEPRRYYNSWRQVHTHPARLLGNRHLQRLYGNTNVNPERLHDDRHQSLNMLSLAVVWNGSSHTLMRNLQHSAGQRWIY